MVSKTPNSIDETQKKLKNLPILYNILCASISASFAETCTISIDTVKVRLMIQGEMVERCRSENKPYTPSYKNMIDCFIKVSKEEGISALFKGLSAGVQRQIVFAGLRIGYYPMVRDFYTSEKDPLKIPLYVKMLAGLTTGTFAIIIASPTDVVKVRLQADGKKSNEQRRYSGSIDAYKKIVKTYGVKGLWAGLVPNIYRNAVINCFELSSYDQFKTIAVRNYNFQPDNKLIHIICGFLSGIIAVTFASPFDVAKTRIMNDTDKRYKGFLNCLVKSVKNEGFFVLYSGYIPNLIRISIWNTICFFALEQCQGFVRNRI